MRKLNTPAAAGLAALSILGGCSRANTTPIPTAFPSPAGSPSAVATAASALTSMYEDGDYTATGWYGGLPSSITVSLTLEDDVITAIEVTPNATDPTSLDYQRRFADAIPEIVVGRPIDEVEVDFVAGSSGTPQGFNDAIEQIKSDAED